MTRILARIAALTALVQAVAHGTLFIMARPHSPAEAAVAAAMWSTRFPMGGALHSYGEMYFGYGLMAVGTCVVEAAVLWLIAPLADSDVRRFRGLAGVIVAWNVAHAALILRYFFLVPLAPDALVALLLVAAIVTSMRKPPQQRLTQPAA